VFGWPWAALFEGFGEGDVSFSTVRSCHALNSSSNRQRSQGKQVEMHQVLCQLI